MCTLVSEGYRAQEVLVKDISVSGTQRTKDFVILREVPLTAGDSLNMSEWDLFVAEVTRNITNTGLTNFVEVTADTVSDGVITIDVEILERWYIWPNIIFSLAETNFNSWWDGYVVNSGVGATDFVGEDKPHVTRAGVWRG